MTGSVRDWPRFFKQAYDNLSPGGVIELQDIIYPMLADDDSLPVDCALKRWSDLLAEAFAGLGSGLDSALHYEKQLTEAGFVDVGTVKEKWPTNRWPRAKKYKQIGELARDALPPRPALSPALSLPPRPDTLRGASPAPHVIGTGVGCGLREWDFH